MSVAHSLLPREVSALIHHVELNRAGWLDKTLNRLVLAIVWLANDNLTREQISRALREDFGLTVGNDKLSSVIELLKTEESLIEIASGVYRIPDSARTDLEREIKEAEESEIQARKYFHSLVQKSCSKLNASVVWKTFEHKFLVPLVRDIGANTYRLITGKEQTVDEDRVKSFLSEFDQEYQSALKAVVDSFLDPKRGDVRGYITRILHTYFCVEAIGLSESVLNKLKNNTKKPLRFRLLVDTNFLFSLLGLHENPSNASASELHELLATLTSNPQVLLYVTPKTIDEAKRAILAVKDWVSRVPMSNNFTNAALRVGMSGLSKRFFAERQQRNSMLTADDWFDPYLTNFVSMARAAGVELFNERFDEYGTRQDVVDDILLVMEYEKKKLPEKRRKSYRNVAHDIILWHSVKDRRPAYVDSPTDAREWILTVDFRLISFDAFKLKKGETHVPLCLHPTSLIQLLQFWVPRTQKFEEVMLSGLRLPFLFQQFDAAAERLSLAIINRLGRFEGSTNIPEETVISVVMNDGLRSRINDGQKEEEQIQLVRDAYLEEMKLRVEAEKAESQRLKTIVEDKSVALAGSQKERTSKDVEINELRMRLETEKAKSRTTDQKLFRINNEKSDLKSKLVQMQKEKSHRRSLLIYWGLFSVTVGLSVITGWLVLYFHPSMSCRFGADKVSVASGLFIFLVVHLLLEFFLGRYQRFKRLWPFKQVRRLRKYLWGIVVTFIIAVVSSLVVRDI